MCQPNVQSIVSPSYLDQTEQNQKMPVRNVKKEKKGAVLEYISPETPSIITGSALFYGVRSSLPAKQQAGR
jgi:hypothetical protein